MIEIDLSKSLGRLPNAIQRNEAVGGFDELLDAYSSWLFFERHFLHVQRFGAERAAELIDTVLTDNIGAAIHIPSDSDLPDYAAPARRAAIILIAAGLDAKRLARLASKVRDIARLK
jgi:hypothetical protein